MIMNKVARLSLGVVSMLIVGFVMVPFAVVVGVGLDESDGLVFPPRSLSITSALRVFEEQNWRDAIVLSVLVGLFSSLSAVTIACLAMLEVRFAANAIWRHLMRSLIILPAFIPTIVYAVGLVIMKDHTGVPAVLVLTAGHAILAVPITYLMIRVGDARLPQSMVEAAYLLTGSFRSVVTAIVLPRLLPFFGLGWLVALAISLTEPILAIFLLSDGTATAPQLAFSGLRFRFDPLIFSSGAVLSLLVVMSAVTGMFFWIRVSRHEA